MMLRASWNKIVSLILCNPKLRSRPRLPPRKNNIHIPDDILVNILVKLPAESILICRCVCRRWKFLTSTPEFVKLHAISSAPVAAWLDGQDGQRAQIAMVHLWRGARKGIKCRLLCVNSISPVSKSPYPYIFHSCIHALHILGQLFPSSVNLKHFVLVNPLTNEKVRLIGPRGRIVGVYLNPFTKNQYCALWLGVDLRPNGSVDYRRIFLGDGRSNSRIIRELYEEDAPVSNTPCHFIPMTVDDVFYWMVGSRHATLRASVPSEELPHSCAESILKFNTKTEKFRAMPHPGPHGEWCREDVGHTRMHLVKINDQGADGGALCLCKCSLLEPVINMWILKQTEEGDNSNPSWVKLWKSLDIHLLFSMKNPYHPSKAKGCIILKAIVNGEAYITFLEDGGGLFALNLSSNIVEKIREGMVEIVFAYNPRLLPIGNSKPEVWMPA